MIQIKHRKDTSETEMDYAAEFVGLAVGSFKYMKQAGLTCGNPDAIYVSETVSSYMRQNPSQKEAEKSAQIIFNALEGRFQCK